MTPENQEFIDKHINQISIPIYKIEDQLEPDINKLQKWYYSNKLLDNRFDCEINIKSIPKNSLNNIYNINNIYKIEITKQTKDIFLPSYLNSISLNSDSFNYWNIAKSKNIIVTIQNANSLILDERTTTSLLIGIKYEVAKADNLTYSRLRKKINNRLIMLLKKAQQTKDKTHHDIEEMHEAFIQSQVETLPILFRLETKQLSLNNGQIEYSGRVQEELQNCIINITNNFYTPYKDDVLEYNLHDIININYEFSQIVR